MDTAKMVDTLGLVEVHNIPSGVWRADGMVKAAAVVLLKAATLCMGRYLIQIAGERGAVAASVAFARKSGRRLADSFIISHVSPELIRALGRGPMIAQPGEALGVVEARLVAAGIRAADAAIKRADTRLLRFAAGQGIAGKSYFVLSGDVAAVRESVEAAELSLGDRLVESVVLPSPDGAVARALGGHHEHRANL